MLLTGEPNGPKPYFEAHTRVVDGAPSVETTTLNTPAAAVAAMGAGAGATPLAFVSTVTLESPPGNLAPAPLAAGTTVNVTGQSSTGVVPSIKVARRPPRGQR